MIILKYKKIPTVGECLSKINYDIEDLDNVDIKKTQNTIERFKYIGKGEHLINKLHILPPHLIVSSYNSKGRDYRLNDE